MNLFTFICVCGYIFSYLCVRNTPRADQALWSSQSPEAFRYSILWMKVFFSTHFKWLSMSIPTLSTLRTLAIQWHNGNENVKKIIGLISKTTTLYMHHTFLYIYLLLCHYCDIKMPSFAFYGEHKLVTMQFYFSFWTWIWPLGIWLLIIYLTKKVVRNNQNKDWKNEKSLFNWCSHCYCVIGSFKKSPLPLNK